VKRGTLKCFWRLLGTCRCCVELQVARAPAGRCRPRLQTAPEPCSTTSSRGSALAAPLGAVGGRQACATSTRQCRLLSLWNIRASVVGAAGVATCMLCVAAGEVLLAFRISGDESWVFRRLCIGHQLLLNTRLRMQQSRRPMCWGVTGQAGCVLTCGFVVPKWGCACQVRDCLCGEHVQRHGSV
jgi:hypothetical protein